MSQSLSRRQFIKLSAAATGAVFTDNAFNHKTFAQAPGIITSEKRRPQLPYGVMSGDINNNSIVIWSKTNKPARIIVEYSTNELFRNFRRIVGTVATEKTDFTARLNLSQLPQAQQIFYRVLFQDVVDNNIFSKPEMGTFRTAPNNKDILFAWSGDTAGQGWGINRDLGGMKIYEAIRKLKPDFFIHSGDTIYADNPIEAEVKLDDGKVWKNITTPEKSKVAETLKEFRGNYIYNLMDENVRRFNAEVPQLIQWDDHEVRNNWYPQQIFDDSRYQVKDISLLTKRAKQAFLEYTPIRFDANDPERIYRAFNYGSLLDILMLDERSYRGANSPNRQPVASADTAFLGTPQLQWLKQKLLNSQAIWKVIASDMPIGLIVPDGKVNFENFANGDGAALGRELEVTELLSFIKQHNIKNVVWVTADVHYAAAHYYNPNKAQFQNFKPFWEFVAGPLNSGTFGSNKLDNTFGPEVKYQSVSTGMKQNLAPSEGFQFFGTVKIAADSKVMTVNLYNLEGKKLYSIDVQPEVS
jgi:alkaline phosphatase D